MMHKPGFGSAGLVRDFGIAYWISQNNPWKAIHSPYGLCSLLQITFGFGTRSLNQTARYGAIFNKLTLCYRHLS